MATECTRGRGEAKRTAREAEDEDEEAAVAATVSREPRTAAMAEVAVAAVVEDEEAVVAATDSRGLRMARSSLPPPSPWTWRPRRT
jgi:hypothetical protein